jgi:hypothetical protein
VEQKYNLPVIAQIVRSLRFDTGSFHVDRLNPEPVHIPKISQRPGHNRLRAQLLPNRLR